MRLAEVLIVAERYDEATDVLAEVFELEPLSSVAAHRLGMILEQCPDLEKPRLLFIDYLIQSGDLDSAENGLRWLLERQPPYPGAHERMETIRAARGALQD